CLCTSPERTLTSFAPFNYVDVVPCATLPECQRTHRVFDRRQHTAAQARPRSVCWRRRPYSQRTDDAPSGKSNVESSRLRALLRRDHLRQCGDGSTQYAEGRAPCSGVSLGQAIENRLDLRFARERLLVAERLFDFSDLCGRQHNVARLMIEN